MAESCIISVAITGSVPRKKDNSALPVTISEQIESTHAAYEAGAALVHVHVRNADETPSSDPEKFAAFQAGIRKHCPDIIVQFSTGGRGRALEQRGAMLYLKPDMASLATGSVNFPTIVYENPPDFVRSLAVQMRDLGIKPEIEVADDDTASVAENIRQDEDVAVVEDGVSLWCCRAVRPLGQDTTFQLSSHAGISDSLRGDGNQDVTFLRQQRSRIGKRLIGVARQDLVSTDMPKQRFNVESFGIVVGCRVVAHTDDPHAAINEFHRTHGADIPEALHNGSGTTRIHSESLRCPHGQVYHATTGRLPAPYSAAG